MLKGAIRCYKMLKVTSKVARRTAMMSALYWGTLFMEGIAELYLMIWTKVSNRFDRFNRKDLKVN